MAKFKSWELKENKIVCGHVQIPLDQVSYIGCSSEQNPDKNRLLVAGAGFILVAFIYSLNKGMSFGLALFVVGAILVSVALRVVSEYRLYSQSGAFYI